MRWRSLLLTGLFLASLAAFPALSDAQSNVNPCKVTTAAPTLLPNARVPCSVDTAGNTRMIPGAGAVMGVHLLDLLSGEDQGAADADPTGSLIRTSGGRVRWRISASAITTNTTSAAFQLPVGPKTLMGQVDGTGAVTATLAVYGGFENAASTTDKILLCTITLSGTTTFVDACPPFLANYLYYVVASTNVTGTGSTSKLLSGF